MFWKWLTQSDFVPARVRHGGGSVHVQNIQALTLSTGLLQNTLVGSSPTRHNLEDQGTICLRQKVPALKLQKNWRLRALLELDVEQSARQAHLDLQQPQALCNAVSWSRAKGEERQGSDRALVFWEEPEWRKFCTCTFIMGFSR